MNRTNDALPADFRDCVALLNRHTVDFVLVGGYAVGWHGVVRATGDIDFLYGQSAENVTRLCDALRAFGAPDAFIDFAYMMTRDAVTQIGHAPLRIDLLSSLSGVSYEEVAAGAIAIEVDGLPLRVIGYQELRRNKVASGRAKDRSDVRELDARRRL